MMLDLAQQLLLLLFFSSIAPAVMANRIRPVDLILMPTASYIQYMEGYIHGPGSIDLSNITFTALSEAFVASSDDYIGDDNFNFHDNNDLNGSNEEDLFFALDMAIFRKTDACFKNKHCDWTQFGVGARSSAGDLQWCCSQDAIDFGMCSEDQYGRLIVGQELLQQGRTGSIRMALVGESKKQLQKGTFELEESGHYVLIFSNCNDEGRDVHVKGQSLWESSTNWFSLDSEAYGSMYYFYIFVSIMSIVLGMCAVWRWNPATAQAHDAGARHMELPASEEDEEDGTEAEVELSSTVPSAMDAEEDGKLVVGYVNKENGAEMTKEGSGYSDNGASFAIDDGEVA